MLVVDVPSGDGQDAEDRKERDSWRDKQTTGEGMADSRKQGVVNRRGSQNTDVFENGEHAKKFSWCPEEDKSKPMSI